jgi:WD40 repeat protein
MTIAAGYSCKDGSGGVVLWDVAARNRLIHEPLAVKTVDIEGTAGVAFSPDGKTIAAGYNGHDDDGVVIWDVAARKRLGDLPLAVKEGYVTSVAFSPDGKAIAAGYRVAVRNGGGVVIWDVDSRKRLDDVPLAVKEGGVRSVAFHPDGKMIAAGYHYTGPAFGDFDCGVVLWDMATRNRLIDEPLHLDPGGAVCVAFSPDGKTIAVGYSSFSSFGVLLWDVDLESWQRRAGRIANRNFTREEWRRYFSETPYRATFPDLPIPPEETPK